MTATNYSIKSVVFTRVLLEFQKTNFYSIEVLNDTEAKLIGLSSGLRLSVKVTDRYITVAMFISGLDPYEVCKERLADVNSGTIVNVTADFLTDLLEGNFINNTLSRLLGAPVSLIVDSYRTTMKYSSFDIVIVDGSTDPTISIVSNSNIIQGHITVDLNNVLVNDAIQSIVGFTKEFTK